MEIFIILSLICAVIGYGIYEWVGAVLGLVFGVFGLLVAVILKMQQDKEKTKEEV